MVSENCSTLGLDGLNVLVMSMWLVVYVIMHCYAR